MRPDTRPTGHYGRRWYHNHAEKRQRYGHVSSCKPHIYEAYFFTSSILHSWHSVHLALRVPLAICGASPVDRVPSPNGIRLHSAEDQQFSLALLFNCGVQPSRISALEGVYLF
jgi:hypothetical protein